MTVPVVPPSVPLPLVDMLMIAVLLEVNVVDAVLSVPFRDAVMVIPVPAGLVDRLMVVPKLEFSVSVVD